MLRLLTSANRDETLLHVMHFVRDEMSRTLHTSSIEQERTQLTSAISQVFRKKGLCWTPRDQAVQRLKDDKTMVLAFDDIDGAQRGISTGMEGLKPLWLWMPLNS